MNISLNSCCLVATDKEVTAILSKKSSATDDASTANARASMTPRSSRLSGRLSTSPHDGNLKARWVEKSELNRLKERWQSLEANAMQVSFCHQFSYLAPALNHLASDKVKLLVVERLNDGSDDDDANSGSDFSGSELVGLLPIEFKKVCGLFFKGAEVWKHDQAFDTTPLLHRDFAADAWRTVCEFLAAENVSLFSLNTVSAEPQMESVLRLIQENLQLPRFQRDHFQRAALRPVESVEVYRQQFCSKKARNKHSRLLKKLAQEGDVSWCVHSTDSDSDWERLTEEFLRLEGSGWKGENGTALNSDPKTEAFFRELVKRSAEESKLRFSTLSLDGAPIAMLCDIQSGSLVYSYKTAFDERFKQHSPGSIAEWKNLESLHQGGIEIVDSCTSPDNAGVNSLWGQKLDFQHVVFGLKTGLPKLLVNCLPLAQSVSKTLRRSSKTNEQKSAKKKAITLTVVDTADQFAQLEETWNQLNVEPMNGFDWNFTWWDAYQSAGQLHILKFEKGGQTIGIAPFYIDRWFGLERLRFIGSGKTCTEYVDVICREEHRDRIDGVLTDYLLKKKFSVIELECTLNDRLANRVAGKLRQHYRCDNRLVEPSWGLELPDTWQAFVAGSGKSLRRKIRKAERRIEAREVHFCSTADGASVPLSFGILRDLHQERFHSKNKPGAFADEKFEAFLGDALERLCARNQAEIIVLYNDEEAIGAQLFLISKHGYQFYQSGYATSHMKLEPGHVMFTKLVQDSIDRGEKYFDFLRGDEPYKKFWGASPVLIRKQRLVSKSFIPQLVATAVTVSRGAVARIKKMAKRS